MGQSLSRGNLKKRNRADLDSNLVFPEGFKWVDGRTYRDEKSLMLICATDEKEVTLWTADHYLWRFVMQGNFQAPVTKELKRGIRVLDVGCGTGVWTLEMASQFPRSHFFGTDIKPLYPSSHPHPNCKFQIVDTLKGLPFDDDTFDYVFQRCQALSYPEKTWPNVIDELVRVTKPGGTIELVEMPFIIYEGGPQTKFYFQQVNMALKTVGHDANFGKALGESLAVAGVEDVRHDYRSWPIGWGHPELGKYTKQNLMLLMKRLKPQISSTLNVSGDKYDQIIAEVNDELGERYQGYANIEVYIARKLGSGAVTATLSK